MMMVVPLHGQDTISESDTCYMVWPHSKPILLYDTIQRGCENCNPVIFWENKATPGTLVYGISLRGYFPQDSTINISLAWKDKEDSRYHYYDTVYLDNSAVFRHFRLRARSRDYDYFPNFEFDFGENCNELYFHRPWPVPDTFYVVIRYTEQLLSPYGRIYMLTKEEPVWPQRNCVTFNDEGEPVVFQPHPYDTSLDASVVVGPASWGHEFPILEPNRTRCRKPTGLQFSERGDTWAILSWNGGAGDLYRVTVEGPDSTYIRETADTSLLLENLTPNVTYWVNLQSLCNYQYYDFSSTYVNPGVARMGFQTFANGMSTPDADLQIALSPNPASQKVEVTSSQPMTRIEVVDAMGRVVESFAQANEDKATLDISLLPAGAYLLRIHTSVGLSCQKLLVR